MCPSAGPTVGPPRPLDGPPRPTGQPPRPLDGPPRPTGQPRGPAVGPPRPACHPERPAVQPRGPLVHPPGPAVQPPRPLVHPPRRTCQSRGRMDPFREWNVQTQGQRPREAGRQRPQGSASAPGAGPSAIWRTAGFPEEGAQGSLGFEPRPVGGESLEERRERSDSGCTTMRKIPELRANQLSPGSPQGAISSTGRSSNSNKDIVSQRYPRHA